MKRPLLLKDAEESRRRRVTSIVQEWLFVILVMLLTLNVCMWTVRGFIDLLDQLGVCQ